MKIDGMMDFCPKMVSFKETAFPIFQTSPSIILNTIANIAIVLNIYVDMLLFGTRFYEAEKSIYEGKSFND